MYLPSGEYWGFVSISLVFFRDVFGFLGGKVVDINVGVGGNGIRQSGFLTACIGHFIRRRAPCQLLDTAPGLHRAFVWLSLKNIGDIADGIAVEISNKRMGSSSHPFVPMLVHQVGNDNAGGFRKVRMFVCRTLYGLYLGNEKEFLAVGRERGPVGIFRFFLLFFEPSQLTRGIVVGEKEYLFLRTFVFVGTVFF